MKRTKLKGVLVSQYKSKNTGADVFVYRVSGTEEALDTFEDAKAEHFRTDDEGHPIFHTTTYVADSITIIVSENNEGEYNVYPDSSELQKKQALVKAMGGDLGKAIAEETARQMVGNRGNQNNVAVKAMKAVDEGTEDNDEGESKEEKPAKPATRAKRAKTKA